MRREVLGYDEFGTSLYPSFRNQPFTFTGYQLDGISDTYYAQARQYKPEIGRFMSQDSHWHPGNMIYGDVHQRFIVLPAIPNLLAIRQSQNLYAYALDNPLIYVDPEGKVVLTTIAIGAGVGVAIGGLFNIGSQVVDDIDFGQVVNSFQSNGFSGGMSNVGSQISNGWNNISWWEVGINAFGGGLSGGINSLINMATYSGSQWVNGEEINGRNLGFEGILGFGFGFADRALTNYRFPDGLNPSWRYNTRRAFYRAVGREVLSEVSGAAKNEILEWGLGKVPEIISWINEILGGDECELSY